MTDIHSFQNSDNYKIALTNDAEYIENRYKQIIEQYLTFAIEQFSITRPSYKKYTIIRGIETVSHVFLFLLYYTKNIEFTCHHTEKSYYYFVEFMQQITEDHSHVGWLRRTGQINEREHRNHPRKNVLSQSL